MCPLTDEIKTLIGDKVTEDQLVDMMLPESQTKLGATHVMRTKADDETFIATQVTAGVDSKIGAKVAELHQIYEDAIKEVTGLTKKHTEKTSDFQKRVLADLKTRADGADGDQALKDQIVALQESLTTKETEHTSALTKIQEQAFAKQLKLVVKGELSGKSIDIPAKITTDDGKQKYITDQLRLIEQDFLNKYIPKEDSEGNIVFYLGDKIQQNTTTGKPLSASELIGADYGSYFSVEKQKQGGAGSRGGDGNTPAGGFKSSEEVYSHLEAQGMERNTMAFTKEASKLIKESGIIV